MPFFFWGVPHARGSDKPDPARLWIESADFLIGEEDREGLKALQEKALVERPWDLELSLRFSAYHLKNRDRNSLVDLFTRLQTALACALRSPPKRAACEALARSWNGNLDSVLFYEDSAQKLEQARRLVEAKDCPAALAVLKEVESREGPAKGVLAGTEKAYKCLGDVAGEARTAEKLKQIRMFPSAPER